MHQKQLKTIGSSVLVSNGVQTKSAIELIPRDDEPELTIVRQVQDTVRDETSLEESDEEAKSEERSSTLHPELGESKCRENAHL